jgi:hypothetical protein
MSKGRLSGMRCVSKSVNCMAFDAGAQVQRLDFLFEASHAER